MYKNQELMPIYTATQSLDIKYHFAYCAIENTNVSLPAANIHSILYEGYRGLLSTRAGMTTKKGSVYKTSIKNLNIATAAVTFLYTDTNTEEGYLGDDINHKTCFLTVNDSKINPLDHRILSTIDFYTKKEKQPGISESKATRNVEFNTLLSERIDAFSNIVEKYQLPNNTISSQKQLDAAINDEMFHETFHHSEQAIMHYFSSVAGLKFLVKAAKECKASYLYGIVLDLYTYLTLCKNCNASLLGLQNSHELGFLFNFSQALEEKGIQPRLSETLMLSTRVSTSSACKGGNLESLRLVNDKKKTHLYNSDMTNQVFQAENSALGTKKIINDNNYSFSTYQGAFLSSKHFGKEKLEQEIKFTDNLPIKFVNT